jgi:Ribbon-helix-helix protein, copG family
MKDDHLTLRLPRALARALARWARERGVPKSQLAREAVARYLSPVGASTDPPVRTVSAAQLAARWALLPRLTPEEASDFAADVQAASDSLPAVRAQWE